MLSRSGSIVSTALVVLIAGSGWLYPLVSFALQGLSLSGMHDEATGFLYFYSLRRLYGVNELPWLHSGQVPSLVHLLLQMGLTAAGYPPTQLHPRLDIWTYVAPAIPMVLGAIILGWAVQPIRSWLGRVLVAVALVAVAYETAGYLEYPLTTSGYHPWVHPVAAILLGWLLRAERWQRSLGVTTCLLGLYAGLCLSIKPSYLPYPLTIGVVLLLRQATLPRAVVLTVGSGLIAVLVVLLTTWGMYDGHAEAVVPHFEKTVAFAGNETANRPLGEWLHLAVAHAFVGAPASLSETWTWIVIIPMIIAIGLALPRRRGLSLALLLGSLLYAVTYDRRPSFATQVEIFEFLAMAVAAWVAGVLGPTVACLAHRRATLCRYRPALTRGVLGIGVLLTAVWAYSGMARFTVKIPPAFQVATEGEHQLAQFLARPSGRTIFAFYDYSHRPVTVDAAIHRGGISIDTGTEWTSPLIREIFDDRSYVTGPGSSPPISLRRYRKLVYAYRPGIDDDETVRALLRERFGIQIDAYECTFTYTFWDTPQMLPSSLDATVVARGCVRRRRDDDD